MPNEPIDFEIIKARTKDDAAVLIDRLLKVKHSGIVLALPKNSILAVNLDAIKILKEEAESVGKTLFIDTENQEILKFAEGIQLPVFDPNFIPKTINVKRMTDVIPPAFRNLEEKIELNMEQNQKQEDKLEEAEINIAAEEIPIAQAINNDAPDLNAGDAELEKNLEEFYSESAENQVADDFAKTIGDKTASFSRLASILVVVGIALFGAAMYLILPKADVNISVKQFPVKASLAVAVSKNVNSPNFGNGIIPGQYFMMTKSGSKPVEKITADANLPLKAVGVIKIYNAYSASSQKLVAQTRFETKNGKIFRIQKAITIPGAKMSGTVLTPSFIEAEVVSDGTGEDYLIGPSSFTIPGFKGSPKFAGFYAKSEEAMRPIENSASFSDQAVEKTKQDLQNELAAAIKNDILGTLGSSDLRLIEGASSIIVDEFQTSGGIASMKISWQAVFFKEKDFRNLVGYVLAAKYPDLKNFDFKDSIDYPAITKSDFKKGEIFFTFNLEKNNAYAIDVNELKKELAGLDENEMRGIISGKNFINSATISLWPFWVRQAPADDKKINITLDNK